MEVDVAEVEVKEEYLLVEVTADVELSSLACESEEFDIPHTFRLPMLSISLSPISLLICTSQSTPILSLTPIVASFSVTTRLSLVDISVDGTTPSLRSSLKLVFALEFSPQTLEL